MNWPTNVVPAVCVGLSGLFTLSAGFVISATGPAVSWSCASSRPPWAPSANRFFVTPLFAGANAGRLGKIRPKCCASVVTNRLRAGAPNTAGASVPEMPPPAATAPAPMPARTRNPRRLYRGGAPGSWVVLIPAPFGTALPRRRGWRLAERATASTERLEVVVGDIAAADFAAEGRALGVRVAEVEADEDAYPVDVLDTCHPTSTPSPAPRRELPPTRRDSRSAAPPSQSFRSVHAFSPGCIPLPWSFKGHSRTLAHGSIPGLVGCRPPRILNPCGFSWSSSSWRQRPRFCRFSFLGFPGHNLRR